MIDHIIDESAPLLYGATTVGERGQVVIPAEARKDLGLEPNTKLLVFGSKNKGGLMITKAETVTDFIAHAMGLLTRFEEMLDSDIGSSKKRNP